MEQSSSSGHSIIFFYITMLHKKFDHDLVVGLSAVRGRQARLLNWALEGTWGAGNKGMLPYLVLVLCVFVDVWMNIGLVGWAHVLVVFLISFTDMPHQRPPNYISVKTF